MKSSHHKTAITIFGGVIPFVLISTLIGATLYGRGKLNQTHSEKVSNFERYKMARIHADGIEATLATGQKREEIAYWRNKIETDFIQSITENLEKILDQYEPSVLRRTAMGQAPGAAAFGSASDHPHSRIQLSFEGGFKPMQMLLAELETEMPHLMLESLEITPMPAATEGAKGKLNFQVIYLCWENSAN
ncbi:MAG: hypothetical protein CMO61_09430 [Verrucomicrobiales bacterium]|nr:hypothetical protein [Verrucomicrobiales bacterium]|tara:strand:+ start:9857 stop:10426 length:570 start_codon:yes stop_codon:yes gene_type:complete